jgi:nucleoside-diphosphate-sugar epimerase
VVRQKTLENLKWREALPRLAADFLMVHLSMIGALAVSVLYRTARGHGVEAQALVSEFEHYYATFFWLLSPIFPVTFWMNGFYTHSRGYVGRYKAWVILRGVVIAVVLFLGANFLLLGGTILGRSVVVPFVVLAGIALSSARFLKGAIEKRFELTPRNGLAPGTERRSVLVVGGAGYVGSLLVRCLLERGCPVKVLDTLLYGDSPLQGILEHPNLELIVGDCRNIQDVVRAVQGVGSIIHLAAIVGDPACEQERQTALETNFAATRMLVEVAKGHGVERFVFASSCSVYGAVDHEVNEKSPANPISLYGQTKVDSENALLAARSASFHPAILRFATLFGLSERPRFDLVVNLLSAKACQEGVITVFNGRQWRPFLHVKDAVEAILRVLDAPIGLVSGEIFNVGDSRLNHTLAEVGEIVREVFPSTAIEHVENSDGRNYRVSFDKIRLRLGFQCKHCLKDGVLEIKTAIDRHRITDYKDVRYHNYHFLKETGSPSHKDELDEALMAVFGRTASNGRAVAAAE